ncbi:MAG: Dam family site-specific DNA-(adenine-N6)-methyltransferase [Crocinitomicaceae bacterium]|nr:Dam family site-specific DNA-(adenine-N6)-methyltransferase [Crocinitomicaceae bacterium]
MQPEPFLKWAGGKRALLHEILPFIREWSAQNRGHSYFEPFLGGGAVLLNLDSSIKKIANDSNVDLIGTYKVIKNQPAELIRELKKFRNDSNYFYSVREWDRLASWSERTPIEKAARFIYLNRTCFNGLYRVNQQGYFNVPFGDYVNPKFIDEDNLMSISKFLRSTPKVRLLSGDYRECLKRAATGDFVYFDPPYDPISKTSAFTAYSEIGFNWDNQLVLHAEATRLAKIGVQVLLSNSNTARIRALYQSTGLFKIRTVKVHRGISAKSSSRGIAQEVLISSQ